MTTQNLLVELFVEELPPKALGRLGESFARVIAEELFNQGLSAKPVADSRSDGIKREAVGSSELSLITVYASPRRLAAHITNVSAKASDKQVAQKLMPASVGLDASGNATPALVKKLEALGSTAQDVSKLRKENDGKADILFLDATQTGATLQEGLQKALEESLAKLPIPKVMTYQINDGWETVNFVRPAHGLVALHGSDIVPVSILGLNAGNTTTGHRFESNKAVIAINDADSYEQQLKTEGSVIASFEARKADIAAQLKVAADKEGLTAIEDEDLLDEVTALVERPNVLLGQFEPAFLAVPQECLVLTMKSNQKYFPLLDSKGKLTNKFLIVSNIHPSDPSAVIGGNERVVRPRLADAKFFFDQDRKKTLESRIANLDKVVYHNKLGSQGERNQRVVAIANAIASQLGYASLVAKVAQAARLSKADLITDMVNEFPELQGIMGRYYAQHEGLDDEVAFAIEDHYKPRFSGDDLPSSKVGICVALADKLETLVGLFSIGEKPTGDKDPFALRRQALGIIRMLIDAKLPLPFDNLIKLALQPFDADAAVLASIKSFCFDRLSVNLKDQGASVQEVDAVVSLAPTLLLEIPQRLAAVKTFANLPEAPALAAANKRVGNILRKVEGEVTAKVDNALLQEPTEIALAAALNTSKAEADKLFEAGDYTGSLQALAVLKAPVDDFFDNVMVNAEDPALKANRLGLLAILHQTMNRVADLSKLAS